MSTIPVTGTPGGVDSPTAALPAAPRVRATSIGGIPALWLLVLWAAMLLLVPSELVVRQIGSAGTPSNLLGLLFLMWWVCAKLGGQITTRVNPMQVALGLFALVVLLALINGLAHGWTRPADIRQSNDAVWTLVPITQDELYAKSVLGAMRGLMSIGSWVGAALLVIDGLRSWRDLDRFISAVVGMSAVVAAMGIYQYFTGDNLARFIRIPGLSANYEFGASISRSVLNRVSATTTHPIEFCVVLTTVLPLAIHRALHPHQTGVHRIVSSYLPALLIGLAIPMAVSRSGIVALFVAMLVLFIGWPRNRRIWVLVLAPPAAILMRSALPGLLGTIKSLFAQSLGDPSVTARTDDYGVVLEIYSQHELFGRGAFTFIPQYYRVLDNQILLTLIELGAVGLAVTFWLFATGHYLARYCKRHGLTAERRHLGLAISAGILAIGSSYATFDAWGFAKTGAVTFLLFGIAGAARRFSHTPDDVVPAE